MQEFIECCGGGIISLDSIVAYGPNDGGRNAHVKTADGQANIDMSPEEISAYLPEGFMPVGAKPWKKIHVKASMVEGVDYRPSGMGRRVVVTFKGLQTTLSFDDMSREEVVAQLGLEGQIIRPSDLANHGVNVV